MNGIVAAWTFSVGRGPDIDNNEIITLKLSTALDLDPRLGVAGLTPEPTVLDFEGDGIEPGMVITDQFAGVTLSTNTPYWSHDL